MQWFYAQNEQRIGPITQTELEQLLHTRAIHPGTLVWREGMPAWQPYQAVRDLGAPAAAGTLPPVMDQAVCAECQQPFNKSDLLRFDNLFVCGPCKPVFFQKLQEGLTPGGGAAVWRSGKFLVMRKDATLPHRCVKCDADASGDKLARKLIWHHPALYLLLIPGLLIYAIIATIVARRARIQIGLCHSHRQMRRRNLVIAWTLFLSSILLFIVGGTYAIGWIVYAGIAAMLAGPIYGMLTCPMVTPKKIDAEFVWLNGVSPQFLAPLGEFPGQR